MLWSEEGAYKYKTSTYMLFIVPASHRVYMTARNEY